MPSFTCMLCSGVVTGAATGGDMWGCVGGPPPVMVVVVVAQGCKGDVLLKDWSRHEASLSNQTFPAQIDWTKSGTKTYDATNGHVDIIVE